ncbi:MAG: cellulase family glycosylhydrolase [Solirubrobacteraceae bacterium]
MRIPRPKRLHFRALPLGVLAALALAGGTARAAAPTPWAAGGTVRAPGGPWLTDGQGRRLELHGVDLVGKCGGGAAVLTAVPGTPCIGPAVGPNLAYVLSPVATDPARQFTMADADTLARLGFDVVRLGIVWEGLEPGPPGVGPNDPVYCAPQPAGKPFPSLGSANPYNASVLSAYLQRTDAIVGLLAQAGIRVMLDMHQDAWGSAFERTGGKSPWIGDGAPPWATCTGDKVFRAPPTWPGAYFNPAVKRAIHNFFANDVRGDLQAQYARVWQAVARHYRGDDDVIGYDIYNEPYDFEVRRFDPELQCDYGGPAHEPAACAHSAARAPRGGLIGAIRVADPGHVVFFEPPGSTNYGAPETVGFAEPLRFHNIALAFHMYGDAATQLALVARERAETRTDQLGGPPTIMDEFGATRDAAATAATVTLAGRTALSWSYWSALQLDDPTSGSSREGLIDQSTGRPYPAMARALAVPYPAATAGTPGLERFDRQTGTFAYSYAVARSVRAPTEIVLPPYTYPHGYTVRVRGAVVVSAGNAPILELRAQRHAGTVDLTVGRRRR